MMDTLLEILLENVQINALSIDICNEFNIDSLMSVSIEKIIMYFYSFHII